MALLDSPHPAAAPRARVLLVLAFAALALAGCDNPDARATRAYAAADGVAVDSAAAAQSAVEQAQADSAAAWNERFGDRVPRPDSVRALYVNAWAAGSRSRMANLIAIADSTEINAFVIDLKESDTYLTYTGTEIALAKEIGADERPASKWMPALIDTLQAHGIYPIARIVVFKDRMLAEQRPDLAIRNQDGGVWKDQKGKPWVNPYSRAVWEYNLAIAREALEMGFAEVQWDYVRFPDVVPSLRETMVFPGADGVSREDNIRNFLVYSKEQLAEYQVPVTADVFGQVTHLEGDSGIGQQWEKISTVADVVLPMVYPSHYYTGFYGFQVPHAHPYEIVRLALEDAVGRDRLLRERGEKPAEVMPWLEAMTATWIKPVIEYGPAQLRSQIEATYDAGLKSWTLWNPGSKYDVFLPALRGKDGSPSRLERSGWKAMAYTPPPARLSPMLRKAAAARAAKADSVIGDSTAAER